VKNTFCLCFISVSLDISSAFVTFCLCRWSRMFFVQTKVYTAGAAAQWQEWVILLVLCQHSCGIISQRRQMKHIAVRTVFWCKRPIHVGYFHMPMLQAVFVLMLPKMLQKLRMFCVMVSLKFRANYSMMRPTSWWSQWGFIATCYYYSWQRWCSDTLWLTLIRLTLIRYCTHSNSSNPGFFGGTVLWSNF
jgi:hypothetical protein